MDSLLVAHIDSLFASGNGVPVERITLSAATWEVMKDYLSHGLPLDFDRIEIERIYRGKTAKGLRAYSPMQAALTAHAENEVDEASRDAAWRAVTGIAVVLAFLCWLTW